MKSIFFGALVTFFIFNTSQLIQQAHADVLSAAGGLAFGRSGGFEDIKITSPILGAEYTFGAGANLQLGGFFDRQMLSFNDGSAGSLNFMGLVGRYHFAGSDRSGPFVYAKAGLGSMNDNTTNSNQKFSYGGGLGYQVVLSSVLSVSPRFGVSYLPDSSSSDANTIQRYDASLMISFHF